MKKISLILTITFLLIFVNSESFSFSIKNDFSKKEQKAAKKYQRKGDRLLRNNKTLEAINFYEKAYTLSPDDAKLNLSLAFCYYNLFCYEKSLPYFETVFKSNQISNTKLIYYLACNYQFTNQFDNAIYYYNQYLQKAIILSNPEKEKIEKNIRQCEYGKELLNNPVNVLIQPLSIDVNTNNQEYSPVFLQNSELLIYTSRRENSIGGLKRFSDNDYFEDIYISSLKLKNTSDSSMFELKFNSRTNDATAGISGDGKTIFIFKDVSGGDIYSTEINTDNSLTELTNFSVNINTPHFESSASLTSDNSTIYFVSDRKDGNFGGKDIYFSTKDSSGNWNTPQNIGNKINTNEDEISVFISFEGNKLYFSSKGHNTIGGFDIFVSEKDETGNWKSPENIGYPINTTCDDVFYSQFGQTGFYSTVNTQITNGFDIYQIEFFDIEEKDSVIVEITDTGDRFGENYNLNLGKDNYLFKNNNFNLIEDSIALVENVKDTVKKPELKFYMNIEFEFGKTEISTKSYGSLDTLSSILILNPDYKIVISGHTDNVGTFDVNQKYSEERANTIANYLITNGVSKELIQTKGFSYSKPIATNDTEEGRAKNRRVEFEFFKLEN
jgi:outer membrane protein OmpA-like peptidoglycan-associated protein/tetratricopeptide (TPR) repeat protein